MVCLGAEALLLPWVVVSDLWFGGGYVKGVVILKFGLVWSVWVEEMMGVGDRQ